MVREWLFGCLLILIVPLAFAHPAVVLSGAGHAETGQAFLTRYADRCYAVLPLHVAAQRPGQGLRRQGIKAKFGELGTHVDLGDDVSVALMSGITLDDCGTSAFSITRAVDHHLKNSQLAVLRSVNADGTVAQMPVTVIDNDGVLFLRVQPTHATNQIRKGASGSILIIDGAAVGMLVSVSARSGVGTVVRQDALMSKVDRYFSNLKAGQQAVTPQGPDKTSDTLSILAWSNLPTSLDSSAANLVAKDEGVGAWRSDAQQKPITLDFKINQDRAVWSGVVLDTRGVPDAELPSTIEVLGSLTGHALNWNSILTATPDYRDGIATLQFAPRRGQWIRLSISARPGGVGTVSLRRVGIIQPGGKR